MTSQGFLTEQGGYFKILYLGCRNSIEGLEAAAFTKTNNTGPGHLGWVSNHKTKTNNTDPGHLG